MSPLDRKLIRDLLQMKGQALAICMVIASGVATFVMSLSTLESLRLTQTTYYDRYRFADVFAQVKRAPDTLEPRIAEIPGVALVQTRIAAEVNLDVPGLPEPAIGRLISVPDRHRPLLNELHLRSGRYLEPGATGEVLVSDAFAEAHGLTGGDSVTAIINGRRQRLHIVGIVLSPEYIIQIRAGELIPDQRRFGVFWMRETELEAAYDMQGAFNDVALSLMRGASESDVIQRLDQLLEPYGGVGAYGRDDQMSHRLVSDEIRQLRGMGLIAPIIFLSVAAFLLNVVLSRQINTQREQIAALKAFGYFKYEIGLHYLKFVLLLAIAGLIVGTVVGVWMGRGLTNLYTQFYRFPVFHFHLDPGVVASALLISLTAGVAGTWRSVRRAVNLPPAEAMRPEPPATFRATFVERLGLGRFLAQTTRMILRQLEREPLKALLSCVGIAMAVAVLVLGNFTRDAIDYMIEFQFHLSQRQDVQVTLVEPTTGRGIHDIAQLPGVLDAEPFRAVAGRLRSGHISRRVGIMGLDPDRRLFLVLDNQAEPVELPPEGITLSEKLAELLGVRPGDLVTIEVMEGERPVLQVPVAALIADFSGLNAYMDIRALQTLMREGNTLSGAFATVDPNRIDQLYLELKSTPRVAAVNVKQAMIQTFIDTIAENQLRMQTFNVIFASIIAFGVVYNTARISLTERSRELATLRVIGFTRMEISAILLGELAVLTLAAIPLGLVMGYGFAAFVALGLDTEMYRIPLVIERSTYAFAALVIVLASAFSGLIVRRRLDHLDLVAVLKSRE
jgi:putative ABC transport system permease protein